MFPAISDVIFFTIMISSGDGVAGRGRANWDAKIRKYARFIKSATDPSFFCQNPCPEHLLNLAELLVDFVKGNTWNDNKARFPLEPYRCETYRISLFCKHSGRTYDMGTKKYSTLISLRYG